MVVVTGARQQPAGTGIYQHVVYFKFKSGVTEAEKQQHMEDFAGLEESIPGIKSYSAGYTFKVPYEKTADYDCAHVVGFSSEEDMETYFHHEAHQRFIERNKEFWEAVEVVNYKTGKQ